MGKLKFLGERAVDLFWTLAVLIFLAALCCPASAQTLVITDAGYFTLETDGAGIPRHVKFSTVVDLRKDAPQPPDPDEPDEPDPPSDDDYDEDIAAQVTGWAKAVDDPTAALAITFVYEHVRHSLRDGKISTASVWRVLADSTDSALGKVDGAKDWSGFRDKLSELFNLQIQRGNAGTSKQIQRLLLSVQVGLGKSVPPGSSIGFDTLVPIADATNKAIDKESGQ